MSQIEELRSQVQQYKTTCEQCVAIVTQKQQHYQRLQQQLQTNPENSKYTAELEKVMNEYTVDTLVN